MEQKQDIGKLIQKQFDGVEKSPQDSLWTKIEATLQKGQKKKRILLLVFLFALILGLNSVWFLGDFYKQTNDAIQTKTTEVSNENNTLESETENNNTTKMVSESTEDSLNEEQQLSNTEPSERLKSKNNLPLKNENSQNRKESSGSEKTSFNSHQNQSDLNEQQENIQNTVTKVDEINTSILEEDIVEVSPEQKLDSIPDEINDTNSKETETNKRSKRWAVTILGGLDTYSSFNKGSLVHSGLDGFKRSGTLDYTYGIALRFDLTEKLAISYGVNKTSFSYYTHYIPSSNETEINRILNYTDMESGQTISSAELSNFLQDETQTDLLHQIEYYELPFIIRYNLSNKRLGVQTLAGLSTYLVNKENLYVQNENDDQLKIGSLNNLTGTRFSVNLGFGLYYELSENFLIELNPTFKYSLSKYSRRTSGDKPYNFGFFTGLTYRIF